MLGYTSPVMLAPSQLIPGGYLFSRITGGEQSTISDRQMDRSCTRDVTWVCQGGWIRMTYMSHTMYIYPLTRVHTPRYKSGSLSAEAVKCLLPTEQRLRMLTLWHSTGIHYDAQPAQHVCCTTAPDLPGHCRTRENDWLPHSSW
jgi:hypothetical protein